MWSIVLVDKEVGAPSEGGEDMRRGERSFLKHAHVLYLPKVCLSFTVCNYTDNLSSTCKKGQNPFNYNGWGPAGPICAMDPTSAGMFKALFAPSGKNFV